MVVCLCMFWHHELLGQNKETKCEWSNSRYQDWGTYVTGKSRRWIGYARMMLFFCSLSDFFFGFQNGDIYIPYKRFWCLCFWLFLNFFRLESRQRRQKLHSCTSPDDEKASRRGSIHIYIYIVESTKANINTTPHKNSYQSKQAAFGKERWVFSCRLDIRTAWRRITCGTYIT